MKALTAKQEVSLFKNVIIHTVGLTAAILITVFYLLPFVLCSPLVFHSFSAFCDFNGAFHMALFLSLAYHFWL